MKFFKGTISNCKKEVLSHTSGSVNVSTVFGNVSGGGQTETKHEHYTNFELDEKIFRCYGDLIFKDGDSVKFYADKTDKGYYQSKIYRKYYTQFYQSRFLF